MPTPRVPALALASLLLAALPAVAQHPSSHEHPPGEVLGEVHFPTTCPPEVQPAFDRAVALLHSFEYANAGEAFTEVARREPGCAMAWWGVAMANFHPLWEPPTPAELAAGAAAAARAAEAGPASERERRWVDAIATFYRDADRAGHRDRARAYEQAMAKLAAAHPDDDEAATFHALALLGSATPGDRNFPQQKRAAEILDRVAARHPRHPGILHYAIHAFDEPELASLAEPAARAYAAVAPSSAHALHMPSHIFTRLGLWDECIASNLASAEAARARVADTHPGATAFNDLHALDYLAYAYLQLGDEARAREVVDRVLAARRFDAPNLAAGYALAAIPARYALERRDWRAAADLALPPAEIAWERFPFAAAIVRFANAVGAARSGDPAGARAAVRDLEATQAQVAAAPPAGPYDWAGQVDALRRVAAGWAAFAEGSKEEAVDLLRSAAELEERVGKHPVTPGAVLPAREQLGDLLLELGRPAEALAAYEAALANAPRRLAGVTGALRAAEAAGDEARAGHWRAERAALCRAPACAAAPAPGAV
jgi:tetratricopeptide (TPR) repeat protein